MMRFAVALVALLATLSTSTAWTSLSIQKKREITFSSPQNSRKSRQHSIPSNTCLFASSSKPPSTFSELLLYNSLSKEKQAFSPINPKKGVTMYTCGPTVYDSAHVGNFRAFLTYDVLKRVLAYFNFDITHVCNLTDVDDKIIARCLRDGVDLPTLTAKYTEAFMQDLESLNIVPATLYPKATQHVDEMVSMIQTLEKKGLAYQTSDGSWYFDTSRDDSYGTQLVDLRVEEMESQSNDSTTLEQEKKNFQDFCLWKACKPAEEEIASWDTPIGKGRPGWHLECSAMAQKYLGDTIDIHCGGIDLKFPHHENEIAQSQGYSGEKFCNCWIHNGFVNIENEKMSKSLGNFLTLAQACPTPMDVRAYRYLVVTSHYRASLSFTQLNMNSAKKSLKRIDKVRMRILEALTDFEIENESELADSVVPSQLQNFEAALKDDLSMPRAAASLFGLVKAAEGEFKRVDKSDDATLDLRGLSAILDGMNQMDKVFGIFYKVPHQEEEEVELKVPAKVMELVGQRSAAKEAKDWELADSLRARISELGFAVKDVKGGEPIVSPIEQ